MSKKVKTKETMFEKGTEFVNLNHAKQVAEKEGKKIKFKLICSAISLVTSIAWLIYGSGVEGTTAEDILGWFVVIGIAASAAKSHGSLSPFSPLISFSALWAA